MRPKLRQGFFLAFLVGLAGLAGAGCAVPVLAPAKPVNLTPAVERVESEINAALLRRGVAPVEVRTSLRTVERRLSAPVKARWVHRSYTLIAHPTFQRLKLSDYVAAVREGARRAGARVEAQTLGGPAGSSGSGVLLEVHVPVRVRGRALSVDALAITVAPPTGRNDSGSGTGETEGSGLSRRSPEALLEPERLPEPGLGQPGEARVAIIIDDWGYAQALAEDFFSLPVPLTMAVIPFLPDSRRLAEKGHAHGWQVLVHLPMQPEAEALDQAEGMIRVTMSDAELQRTVAKDLDAVPHAVGVNNHMGSRATGDYRVMRAVLGAVAERGWFFVDSRTTPRSVIPAVARELGLAYGENFVFLDNRADVGYIRRSLQTLVRAAQRNGYAIGIGHVRRETLAALQAELPLLLRSGVRFVPVSQVVRRDFRYRWMSVPKPSARPSTPAPAPQAVPPPAAAQPPLAAEPPVAPEPAATAEPPFAGQPGEGPSEPAAASETVSSPPTIP